MLDWKRAADVAVRCVLLSLSTCQPANTHTVVGKRLTGIAAVR